MNKQKIELPKNVPQTFDDIVETCQKAENEPNDQKCTEYLQIGQEKAETIVRALHIADAGYDALLIAAAVAYICKGDFAGALSVVGTLLSRVIKRLRNALHKRARGTENFMESQGRDPP